MQLGSAFFDVSYNEKSLDTAIEQIRRRLKEGFSAKVTVDDRELTDLNKHIDSKIRHISELNRKTVNVKTNNKGLEETKTLLEEIKQSIKEINNEKINFDATAARKTNSVNQNSPNQNRYSANLDITVSIPEIKTLVSLVKEIFNEVKKSNFPKSDSNSGSQANNNEESFYNALTKHSQSQVRQEKTTQFTDALARPFGDVQRGLFEGIGNVFGKSLGEGMQSSLEKMFSTTFKKQGSNIVDFATSNAKTNSFNRLLAGDKSGYTGNVLTGQTNQGLGQKQYSPSFATLGNENTLEKKLRFTLTKNLSEVKNLKGKQDDIKIAKQKFENIKDAFKSAYKKFQESLNRGNLELANSYADTIKKMSEVARNDIDTLKESLKKKGVPSQFGSELSTIAGSTKGVIKARYENPSQRDIKLANSYKTSLDSNQEVAKNVLSGITTGLSQGKGAVYQSSAQVAELMLKAMRDKLGIKSPARAFIDMMKFVGQGILQGAKDIGSSTRKAGEFLGQTVIEPFSNKINEAKKSYFKETFSQRRQFVQESKEVGSESFFDRQYAKMTNFMANRIHEGLGYSREKSKDTAGEIYSSLYANQMLKNPLTTTVTSVLMPFVTTIAPTAIAINQMKDSILIPLWNTVTGFIKTVQPILTGLNFISKEGTRTSTELMSFLKETSNKYATPLASGSKNYVQLASAAKGTRLEGEGTDDLFKGISASSKSLGLDEQSTDLMFTAYIQMLAKGKISMEELRQQLSEKFPPAMKVFAESLGVSVAELQQLSADGRLLAEEVLPKVAKTLLKNFDTEGIENFTTAFNRLKNEIFTSQVNISKYFDGMFSGVSNFGTGLIKVFNDNFDGISRFMHIGFIGLAAQVAVGLQTMFSLPILKSKIDLFQNLFMSTFKNSMMAITPFMFSVFVDMIDELLGAKNSIFDNLSRGVTNMFVGLFSALESAKRNSSSGGSLFEVNFDEKQLSGVDKFKQSIQSFFSIIPSGVVEFGSLYVLMESFFLLLKMYLLPVMSGIGQALVRVGSSVIATVRSAGTLSGMLKVLVADSALAKAGLMALNVAFKGFLTLGILAFAQSDFTNPLNTAIRDSKINMVNAVHEMKASFAELKGEVKGVSEEMGKMKLPKKGLELNPLKVIGLSNDSFTTDDLIEQNNKPRFSLRKQIDKLFMSDEKIKEREESGRYAANTPTEDIFNKKILPRLKKEAESLGLNDLFNGQERGMTLAQEQLLNNARDLAKVRDELREQLKLVNTSIGEEELEKTLQSLRDIDNELKDLQTKRRDASKLIPLGRSGQNLTEGEKLEKSKAQSTVKSLDEQIAAVLKKRGEISKKISPIVSGREDIQKQFEEIIKNIESSGYRSGIKQKLKEIFSPLKEIIQENEQLLKQSGIENLLNPLEKSWAEISQKLADSEDLLTRLQRKTKLFSLGEQTQILNSGQSEEVTKKKIENVSISTLQQTEQQLVDILRERNESLDELLAIGGRDINDEKRKETEKIRESIEKDEITLAETRLSLAQQRQNVINRLKGLVKETKDFYEQIVKDTEALNLEIATTRNSIALTREKNKFKQALLGFQDTFVTSFVEGLMSMLDIMNQPIQQYLQNVQAANNARDKVKSTFEQGQEVFKKLQTESIQPDNLPSESITGQSSSSGGGNFGSKGITFPLAKHSPVTSEYGWRTIFGSRSFHKGIDFGVPTGTNVHSPTAGKVSNVFNDKGGGLTVTVQSIDSMGKKIEQSFLHLSSSLVKVGQEVAQGQVIAKSGNSGARTTGAHLDYRVKINGEFLNPREFWKMQDLLIPGKSQSNPVTNPNPSSTNVSQLTSNPTKANIPMGMYGKTQEKLSDAFLREAVKTAEALGTKPEYLLAVMGFETGGKYKASTTNSLGYTGLIQFSPKYSPGNVGKTTDELRKMGDIEQMQYIKPYLDKNRRGKSVSSLEDLYMSVLMPTLVGKGKNASLPGWAYKSNRGLDIDKDGKIQVHEATAKVRDYLNPNVLQRIGLNRGQASTDDGTAINTGREAIQRGANQIQGVNQTQEQVNEALNKINEANNQSLENYKSVINNANSLLTSEQEKANLDLELQKQRNARILEQGLKDNDSLLLSEKRTIEDQKIDPNSQRWVDRYAREQIGIERKYEDTTQRLQENLKKIEDARNQLQALLAIIQKGGLNNQALFDEQIPLLQSTLTKLDAQSNDAFKILREQSNLKKTELERLDKVFAKEKDENDFNDIQRLVQERITGLNSQADLAESNQRDRFDTVFGDPLELRKQAKDLQIELELTTAIRDLIKFKEVTQISAEELKNLENNIRATAEANKIVNQSQFDRSVTQRNLEKKRFEFENSSKFTNSKNSLLQAQGESLSSRGLNILARPFEKERLLSEQNSSFQSQILDLEEWAFSVGKTKEDIKGLREELESLNTIKLEGIREQFNPFSEIANSAISGLQSSIEGLISGTMSFGDAFMNFGQTISQTLTKMAAEWVTNELIGSLFGGITGSKKSGGGTDLWGKVIGVLGFSKGGEVPAVGNLNKLRNSSSEIGKALRREGNNSVLATLTPGERVLTPNENEEYKRLMKGNRQILSFKNGGELYGNVNLGIPNFKDFKGGNNVIVDASIKSGLSVKEREERELRNAVRAVVVAEIKRFEQMRR